MPTTQLTPAKIPELISIIQKNKRAMRFCPQDYNHAEYISAQNQLAVITRVTLTNTPHKTAE